MPPPNKPEARPFFWISLVVHAVVIGAILYFSPVRQWVFEREPPPPEVLIRDEKLAQIIDDIRAATAKKLEDRVSLLEQAQSRMAENFVTVNSRRDLPENERIATLRTRWLQLGEDVATQQNSLRAGIASEDPVARQNASETRIPRILAAQLSLEQGIPAMVTDPEPLLTVQTEATQFQKDVLPFLHHGGDALTAQAAANESQLRVIALVRELPSKTDALP